MMMMLMWILSAIVTWRTPPPPIQGFDRWEPAALFWIGTDGDGNRGVVEGPNHDKLIVKNVGGRDSRSYLEFDLEALPEEFDLITLNILISNGDPGPPVELVEFFHYAGDGERDIEDWDAGEHLAAITAAMPPRPKDRASVAAHKRRERSFNVSRNTSYFWRTHSTMMASGISC